MDIVREFPLLDGHDVGEEHFRSHVPIGAIAESAQRLFYALGVLTVRSDFSDVTDLFFAFGADLGQTDFQCQDLQGNHKAEDLCAAFFRHFLGRGVEGPVLIAAMILRGIHREIRSVHELFEALEIPAVAIEMSHAHRSRQMLVLRSRVELRDPFPYAFRDGYRSVEFGFGQYHEKFGLAGAAGEVDLKAHRTADRLADLVQHRFLQGA